MGAQPGTQASRTWALTLLSIGLVGGVYIVLWAARRGLVPDAAVSPYHLPAYASLAVLLLWVVVGASRAFRLGAGHSPAWPLDDRPLVIGLVAVVAYIVLDVVWREIAPIGEGIEGAIAPTRLLLAAGLALIAGAALRAARREGAPTGVSRLPALISAGLVAAGLGFAVLPLHPAFSQWLERPADSREDDSEIWVMQADGGHQTRLLRAGDGVELSLPAWSPDGQQLAGTGWDLHDPKGAVAFLWTARADGTNWRRITNAPGWQWIPAWSPAGDWIAYTLSSMGPTVQRAAPAGGPQPGLAPGAGPAAETGDDVWMVRPDGTGARQLITRPANDSSAVWSPDGQNLLFVSDRDGNPELYIGAADGSNARRLTDDPGRDWAPAWSPDGRQIVFTSDRGGSDDVWLVNDDGSGLRQLTNEPGSDAVPVWSPRGDRIAFASDRSGDVEVWSMSAAGGDLRNLTQSPASSDGQWSVAWSPDGQSLAYASAGLPPALALPVIREDLAVAGTLLGAVIVAGVATLAVGLGFGTATLLLGISSGLAALAAGDWGLAAAAIAVGLVLDIVLGARRRQPGAPELAALVAAGVALVPVLWFALRGALYWTPTLSIGVVLLAGGAGWVIGMLAAPRNAAIASAVPVVDRQ
jgi:Tol biopolymer transport system component